jgi:hypothetical protein
MGFLRTPLGGSRFNGSKFKIGFIRRRFQWFQWFHRLRGSKRTDSQSLAKEISPTGEGVNASRRGSRFNGSKVQRRIYSKTVPVVPSHEKATGNSSQSQREA